MGLAARQEMDYLLYGWRVRSELSLPQAALWEGEDRPVDVEIRLGEVSDKLADPIHTTPFIQIAGNGDCRLEIAAAGRYLVRGGREVVVQPAPDATIAEISVFLLGSVIGLLCHQRGLFPLHASCVRIDEGAVAFCGPSGAGKSTMAAALLRRGHSLLCDDITIVDPYASGGPLVYPAMPRMRLWRDSLEALDIAPDRLQRDRVELEKYVLPANETGVFLGKPQPLKAVFMLQSANSPQLERTFRMQPMEAVAALGSEIYRRRQAYALGRKKELFRDATKIAGIVPVLRLARQLDFALMDVTTARVEDLVGV